jgi:hypothetical protein
MTWEINYSSLLKISSEKNTSTQQVSVPTTMTPIEVNLRVSELIQLDDYDEDFLKPSLFAAQTTVSLLNNAQIKLGRYLPKAHISPDGDGGIWVEWIGHGKRLFLSIPAHKDAENRLFYKWSSDEHRTENNVFSDRLADFIVQFSMNEQHQN